MCGALYPLATREYDKQFRAYAAALPDYSHIVPPIPYIEGRPVKLEVPSVGITMAVIDGAYDSATRSWTLSHDKVQFDTSSSLANPRDGNTFIYGHATEAVFGPLLKIQPGAMAYVTTETGWKLTYQLTSHEVVEPTNTSVLRYSGPSRLMLQTCTGPTLSEFRQLFYFSYVSYEKAPATLQTPIGQ